MLVFPSVEWFEEVKETVNRSKEFRALGNCDANVGVKVGEKSFSLKFEAFSCEEVSEIGVEGLGGLGLLPGDVAGGVAGVARQHQVQRQGRWGA